MAMNRRDFMKAAGAAGGFCLAGCVTTPEESTASLPNIVYILADDMGYGDVGALNPEGKIPTPNLDRIAKEGMHFTDAHSGSAVCTPTRYGVLTGQYSWRTRLKRGVFQGYSTHLIAPERMTVASLLKESGYNTACVGKWHIGMDMPTRDGSPANAKNVDWKGKIRNGPNANGFDYFYGISASLDMHPYIWIENDRFVGECTTRKAFHRMGPAHKDFEAVDVLPTIGKKTCEFIGEQSSDKPFFIYVPLASPHTPIVPSKEFVGKTKLGKYGDFCFQTDAVVGDIMEALKKKDVADNTIIIFTSDNGCSPQAKFAELAKKGHHPSYVFRGHKADIYEGGHRIPFLLRWPAKVTPGSKSDETICLTDLLATCAAITGRQIPKNAGEDSYNILPAILGEEHASPIREATVHHSINGSFSIRKGKWKLELCPGSGGWSAPKPGRAPKGAAPIQLYDLEKDIGEKNNIQAKHPEVVKELTALLEKYRNDGRSVRR
jgi:arylsulfatase A-like enzyme